MCQSKRLFVGIGIPLIYQLLLTVFGFAIPVTLIPPWGWLMLHGLTDALFIVCPLLAVGLPLATAWKTVGGRALPWIDCTLAVLLGGLCVFFFQEAYDAIALFVFRLPAPEFGFTQSAQDILAFILWVVLIGPLGEEVFFRGYLGYLFPKAWQFVVVSSVLWAGFHVDVFDFIPLVFMGVVLAVARVKTHSFYPALLIHLLLNALSLFFHFLA